VAGAKDDWTLLVVEGPARELTASAASQTESANGERLLAVGLPVMGLGRRLVFVRPGRSDNLFCIPGDGGSRRGCNKHHFAAVGFDVEVLGDPGTERGRA
jgi:hypothetical protein